MTQGKAERHAQPTGTPIQTLHPTHTTKLQAQFGLRAILGSLWEGFLRGGGGQRCLDEERKLVCFEESTFQGRVGTDSSKDGNFELGTPRGKEEKRDWRNEVSWSFQEGDKVPVREQWRSHPRRKRQNLDWTHSTFSIISQNIC